MPRGRDLTYRIVTDLSRFVTDAAVDKLEDLVDASRDTDTRLEDLAGTAKEAGTDLDRLGRSADGLESDLEKAGRAGKDMADDIDRAADDIDDSFDAIDSSARNNLDLSRHAETATRGMQGLRDEAADTAREMGASFSGSSEDVLDAMQELAANAGVALGPIGVAAGAAAAVGVGLIRAESEKLTELTNDFIDEMIDAGGRLDAAAIDNRIKDMAREDADGLTELKEAADRLGLSFIDLARGKAGDMEASERARAAIAELRGEVNANIDANRVWVDGTGAVDTELAKLERELDRTAEAHALATEATSAMTDALSATERQSGNTRRSYNEMHDALSIPTTARVNLDAPSAADLDAVRARIKNGIGNIIVPITASAPRMLIGGQRGRT